MGIVTGTVKVDGELAKTGAVVYIPVDGDSSTAGAVITDGVYTANDVAVGIYKVEVRVSKVVGHQKLYDTPDSKTHPVMVEVLPDKYNNETELQLDVKPGKNKVDYDLSSK